MRVLPSVLPLETIMYGNIRLFCGVNATRRTRTDCVGVEEEEVAWGFSFFCIFYAPLHVVFHYLFSMLLWVPLSTKYGEVFTTVFSAIGVWGVVVGTCARCRGVDAFTWIEQSMRWALRPACLHRERPLPRNIAYSLGRGSVSRLVGTDVERRALYRV